MPKAAEISKLDRVKQIKCPHCNSADVQRIHRSRWNKICRRNPKFRCSKCGHKFFRKIA